MRRALVIALVLFFAASVPARADADSTAKVKAEFRVLFNFDFRRTFVNSDPVSFYGFRLGAQRKRDIIAVGFYGLGNAYVQEDVDLGALGIRELRTNFDFTTLAYERILLETKRWTIGLPLSVGLGTYRTSYLDSTDHLQLYSTNELVPLEASIHVDYNIFWWFFVGVGGGYRHVLAADRNTTITLSDMNYFAKAGLRVGALVKRARKEMRRTRRQERKGHGT
ncbi:MAG: hypothetical protein WAR83_03330 [Flavobacteriales bacterium]|nr:hypothetical protein [Flavobacteriales bacterium]